MKTEQLQTQKIAASIHLVRSHKVMLDTDLARMYGVETKYLKRQVNRNRERFPSDFMFTLRKHEVMRLRCQIGTLDRLGRGKHTKY
ncbi:MAG TPA: ORF6N domain-containing protein, partial [Candidatus Omnitrophota bacterium]|nr:ORF6N domain-containing protein [Candidatus Omnitrophota bacterium]